MVNSVEGGDKPVTMARLGKPHGLKGWLRIHSFTEPPSNIANYRVFHIKSGPSEFAIQMDQIKQQGNGLLAHFKGYDQPEQAQALVGMELLVEKQELPELQEGEFYWHQLQGLTVTNLQGQKLGTVKRMLETGANDVLVVSPDDSSIDKNERLIPYLADSVVKNIDLEHEVIEVDWESDYLI